MFDDDAHAFGLRAKGEALEDVIFFGYSVWVLQSDVKLFSFFELHVQLLSKLDKCNLIRTSSLEFFLSLIIGIRVDWSHIVTEGKRQDKVTDHEVVLTAETSTASSSLSLLLMA